VVFSVSRICCCPLSVEHIFILCTSSPSPVSTFSNASNTSNTLAVATSTPEILLLNSMTGNVIRQASSPSAITELQFSHSVLLSGSSDGFLRKHDPRTGMRKEDGESLVKAHAGGVQDLQVSGNFVFTIGWGIR
jgi:hypothetical protein